MENDKFDIILKIAVKIVNHGHFTVYNFLLIFIYATKF